MHQWGDKDVDWKGINDAAYYIAKNLKLFGISVNDFKEKYGTVRVYCTLGYSCLALYVPYKIRKKLPMFVWSLLNKNILPSSILYWFQSKIYRFFYKKAIQKWPHLRQEILYGADYDELLVGL